MKIKDMPRVVALNNEMEALRNMQKLIADTASNNLAVGLRTTFVCSLGKNERQESTSKRLIELFDKALYTRLNEIEKEIEIL